MSLACDCGEEHEWYYEPPEDFIGLDTKRRRRCISCAQLIDIGADCLRFYRWHPPNNDIEERIHGGEVPMPFKYMCEECGGLFLALEELGFCINLTEGENMRELVDMSHDIIATKTNQRMS